MDTLNLAPLMSLPGSPFTPRQHLSAQRVLEDFTLEECLGLIPDTDELLSESSVENLCTIDLDNIIPLQQNCSSPLRPTKAACSPPFRPTRRPPLSVTPSLDHSSLGSNSSPLKQSLTSTLQTPDSDKKPKRKRWGSEPDEALPARKSSRRAAKVEMRSTLATAHEDLQAVLVSGRLDTKRAMAVVCVMRCLALDDDSIKELTHNERALVMSIRQSTLRKHEQAAEVLNSRDQRAQTAQ